MAKNRLILLFCCLFCGHNILAQSERRLSFEVNSGMCRRVKVLDGSNFKSNTVPLFSFKESADQQNRYDAFTNSLGCFFDLRKERMTGLAMGIEMNHFFSKSQFDWRTEPYQDLIYFKTFHKTLSVYSLGTSVLQRGLIFRRENIGIHYSAGLQADFKIGQRVYSEEIVRTQANVNQTDEILNRETLESSNISHYASGFWISLQMKMDLVFYSLEQKTWSVFIFNNRFGGTPVQVVMIDGVWDYSDETGVGFSFNF